MIKTPTTFIVGAGASRPYDLPLGADLMLQAQALTPADPVFQLLVRLPTNLDIVLALVEDLKSTPVRSIDDYIAKRQNQSQKAELSRALIAALMARAIAIKKRPPSPSEDWLGQVIQWMIAGAHSRPDFDKGNVNVRFVTFNFDSTIEERLTHDPGRIYSNTESTDDDPVEARVIHVHGDLPPLPDVNAQNPFIHTLDGDVDPRWVVWLRNAARRINVMVDPVHDEIVQKAQRPFGGDGCLLLGIRLRNRQPNKARDPRSHQKRHLSSRLRLGGGRGGRVQTLG